MSRTTSRKDSWIDQIRAYLVTANLTIEQVEQRAKLPNKWLYDLMEGRATMRLERVMAAMKVLHVPSERQQDIISSIESNSKKGHAVQTSRWGTILEDKMRELGLSQHDVAEQCGVTQTAVWYWLRGRSAPPLDGRLDKMIRALGLKGDAAQEFRDEAVVASADPVARDTIRTWLDSHRAAARRDAQRN